MLWVSIYIFLVAFVSTERALPDYTKDEGIAPEWMDSDGRKNAVVDRWYVEKADATCKPFKYLGSLGNFNNFVSKAACLNHLKFTQEEKAEACGLEHKVGDCQLSGDRAFKRWYFKFTNVSGVKKTCHEFKYTGCGGNANNFESEDECNNVCNNKENGSIKSGELTDDELTAIPNEFDCTFVPEVKTFAPVMGIVPHKDGKRCVYAAIGKEAKRGFFEDLPTCVKTCIKKTVPACLENVPYQTPTTGEVTNDAKVYYYFKQSESVCLPFMSKQPEGTNMLDDGTLNIFSSPELCASFCPATKNIGQIMATQPCTQKVVGVKKEGDTYTIKRHYYNPTATGGPACTAFDFNGKEMNLNNFESSDACDAICKNPLKTGA